MLHRQPKSGSRPQTSERVVSCAPGAQPEEGASDRGGGGRWFAVRTQPRREKLALLHLARQNFESFCPMWRGTTRPGRQVQPSLSPLFPSYVFARLDLDAQRWRSVNGTVGCVGLVTFGARPAALPTGFVEAMMDRCIADGEIAFGGDLAAGDEVRVVGGALDNFCGTLIGRTGAERAAVLIEMMNREMRVEIAAARLIAA